MSTIDTKQVLTELANMPAEAEDEARRFLAKHGVLRQWKQPWSLQPLSQLALTDEQSIKDVLLLAAEFRRAWNAAAGQDEKEMRHVSDFIDSVFTSAPGELWAVMSADFSTGKWEPIPRDLLDRLVLRLMRSRNMLHRCENPDCQKYIVKEYSNDKYCSHRCSGLMRKRKLKQWREGQKAKKQRRRKVA